MWIKISLDFCIKAFSIVIWVLFAMVETILSVESEEYKKTFDIPISLGVSLLAICAGGFMRDSLVLLLSSAGLYLIVGFVTRWYINKKWKKDFIFS